MCIHAGAAPGAPGGQSEAYERGRIEKEKEYSIYIYIYICVLIIYLFI